jgi:zinc protease
MFKNCNTPRIKFKDAGNSTERLLISCPMRSKKHLMIASLAVLSASLLPACAGKGVKPESPGGSSADENTVPLVGNYLVHRYTLANGLRLLVVEDHSSPTLAYQTWFRVGSRDETLGRTGLAHLFEHMMFKGTKNLKDGEFDKLLENSGAEGENAFTSRDYTAYVEEMPSDKLDLVMRLESDRMINLVVDEKAFKTETEVVQNERRFRNENSPDGLMYQNIFETSFTKHSYHWPVVGYQKDLEAMSAADARAFYTAYYSPNHATVVVVGDVNPEQVLSMAKKYYGALAGQITPVHQIEPEPQQIASRRQRLKLNIQVEKMLMGYHIPGILDKDMAALDVLEAILTGGKSSRLHRALVESGIASGVDAYDLEDKDPSLFIIAANLQKGKKASQAESVILKEVARLAKEAPSEQEMARARNRINFSFFEGLDTNSEKAKFLGHYEAVANDFTLGLEHFKQVSKVTSAEVQAVAKRFFDPKNRTVITGVNK